MTKPKGNRPLGPMQVLELARQAGHTNSEAPVEGIVEAYSLLRDDDQPLSDADERIFFELCSILYHGNYHGLGVEAGDILFDLIEKRGLRHFRDPAPKPEPMPEPETTASDPVEIPAKDEDPSP